MKRKNMGKLIISVFIAALPLSANAEKAPKKVVDFGNKVLAKMGTNSDLAAEIEKANKTKQSLAEIQKKDDKWKKTPGIDPYMKSLLENKCAKTLKGLISKYKFIVEAFAMGNQGENVCMTEKTSDYWQGDEAKFKKSYNGGKGQVFVDEVEFDDSTQTYLVQISVPVSKGGKVIGAITFGVELDSFE